LARGCSTVLTLISLPLAVRYLGAERYGVWATVTTTVVWINLLDLGIANTLTNHLSRAFALNDKHSAARYFTNALFLTGGIAVLAGILLACLLPQIDWPRLLNVSRNVDPAEVRETIAVACGIMLLALPCNLVGKVLAGYQELHRNSWAAGVGAVASLGGLALGIALRVSMPILFLMSAGCLTLANLVHLVLIVGWQKRWLIPRVSCIDRTTTAGLLSSGSPFFLIQLAAVAVFSSDNLIVSHYCGASAVTPYSVTWRVVGLTAVLQSLMFPALWPAYAEAYARGDLPWIRRTFAFAMKGTLACTWLCVAFFLLCGRSLIRMWAGPAAVPDYALLLAMGAWAVINGFMSVESCLLAALNRTRGQAALSMAAAALNIVLSLLLVRHVGPLGVIGGTILSYLIVLVVPQSLIVRSVWRQDLAGETRSRSARSSPFLADTQQI